MTQIGSIAAVERRQKVQFRLREDVLDRLVTEEARRGVRREEIILAAVRAQSATLGEVLTSYVDRQADVLSRRIREVAGREKPKEVLSGAWMTPSQRQELQGLASNPGVSLGRLVSAVLDHHLPPIAERPIIVAAGFAEQARSGPDWFEELGGPESAARTAAALRDDVLAMAQELLEASGSAIAELLKHDSVEAVAARLDMHPVDVAEAGRAWRQRSGRGETDRTSPTDPAAPRDS